jgi:hydrogenase/urease accessory protein HupE
VYEPNPLTGQPYIGRVLVELRFRGERPIERVRAHVAFFSDLTSIHRALVVAHFGGKARQFVRQGPADLELVVGEGSTRWQVVGEFLRWGAEHIFVGYDHIAFLLALLLVAGGLVELLKIVTSFTVAHSLTLLLAALDLLRIPSRLTEVLIAASIVYVAAENLWLKRTQHRWWLTFLFGLVHGLGFATQLRERLSELEGSVLLPVVSFNLGVELGQIAIVSLAFPLLLLARRRLERAPRPQLLVRFGSIPILALGLYWFVERLVG